MSKLYASDTIMLGDDRPLQPGDEVPETYTHWGKEYEVDVDRLKDLGVVSHDRDFALAAAELRNELTAKRAQLATIERQEALRLGRRQRAARDLLA